MAASPRGRSKKKQVIEHLYNRWRAGDLPDGIAYRSDVTEAIAATGATLSVGNLANFLKDLIRKKSVLGNWPDELVQNRVSARQRYGLERVLQFFEYPASWPSPFPDWHMPVDETPVYTIQSVSIDSLARSLGRSEESWLTQVAVNLHLVHTQLAIFSTTGSRRRLRDVRHLQMSIKTQPEIDAAFIATYRQPFSDKSQNTFVTLEAKQKDERILLDQIREQVAKAFAITAHLDDPPIDSIKPLALQVVRWPYEQGEENMLFLVEFQRISRRQFERLFSQSRDPLLIYDMEMRQVSATLFRLAPPLPAISG